MKVLFISPGLGVYNEQPPLGLIQLAGYLEKFGHEIKILNRPCLDNPDIINKFKPDFIGITGTTRTINDAYYCADRCRKKGYWVVIGGIHATALPEEALQHADTVITGEGEIAMKEFLDNPTKGIIKGKPLENLDELGIPAYHLIDMNYYINRREGILNFASNPKVGCILTSRGCPWSCSYCYNSFRESPVRYSTPEYVMNLMNHLSETYGINMIIFLEDNFFVNKPRAKRICELMLENKNKFVWCANSRVDNLDPEILELAHRAGCMQIAFGIESGSQRILDVLNKRTTVEKAKEAIKLCDDADIIVSASFMFSNPTETIEDVMMTRKFILENNIDGPIGFMITMPFPGTKIWEWCKEHGKIPDYLDWNDFDYRKMPIYVSDIQQDVLENNLAEISTMCSSLFFQRETSRIRKRRNTHESGIN